MLTCFDTKEEISTDVHEKKKEHQKNTRYLRNCSVDIITMTIYHELIFRHIQTSQSYLEPFNRITSGYTALRRTINYWFQSVC